MSEDVLFRLAETIKARRSEAADKSYTRQLLDAGPERCAKKLGEEAVELVIAGVSQSDQAECPTLKCRYFLGRRRPVLCDVMVSAYTYPHSAIEPLFKFRRTF